MASLQRRWRVTAQLVLFAFSAGLLLPGLGVAVAQVATTAALDKAQGFYNAGEFQIALDKAAELLAAREALDPMLRREALVLAARCQVQLDRHDEARASFREVIELEPTWEPDPLFLTPAEIVLYDEVAASLQEKSSWWQKWYVIGPAAAAVVGLVVSLTSGGDSPQPEQPLDTPPPPPGGR